MQLSGKHGRKYLSHRSYRGTEKGRPLQSTFTPFGRSGDVVALGECWSRCIDLKGTWNSADTFKAADASVCERRRGARLCRPARGV